LMACSSLRLSSSTAETRGGAKGEEVAMSDTT
jgi:hypothetical protein